MYTWFHFLDEEAQEEQRANAIDANLELLRHFVTATVHFDSECKQYECNPDSIFYGYRYVC